MNADLFDPNEHRARCETYLGRVLDSDVHLARAERLAKSTRSAPWRLDVKVAGASRRYVLRLGTRRGEHEYAVLRAMESVDIPTPRAYGWDPRGDALGVPSFFCDFVDGDSLLGPMKVGARWAEDLFIATACALQSVTKGQLSTIASRLSDAETAEGFLASAWAYFESDPHPLATSVYTKLTETKPELPAARFSNGDLWLDNLIVRDGRLAGVIDFEHAGFSDPIYEALLPFFVSPELRGRGVEERYCEHMGFDVRMLTWYRGLEYLDTWRHVKAKGKPFEGYTSESIQDALRDWLDGG